MAIVFTPNWFMHFDVLIEIFSFLVLAVFFGFSLKSYKLIKNKKILYLGIGFLTIALAELSTILTKLVFFYKTTFTHQIGVFMVTYNVVKSTHFFYDLGFFLHHLFLLSGLYVIYRFPLKSFKISDVVLTIFFIFLSAVLSQTNFYIFHITVIVLLILILLNFAEVYKENKSTNTKILLFAFSFLLVSHSLFSFSKLNFFYVIAQTIQLISYLTFLFLIIKITKYDVKKDRTKKRRK